MSMIHFSGTHYRAPGYHFERPGDYEVPEEKAAQLLRDFPDRFSVNSSSAKPTDDQSDPTNQPTATPPVRDVAASAEAHEGSQNEVPTAGRTPSLTKMNRAQLEATAAQIGLDVTNELDTNAKLVEAIQRHQHPDHEGTQSSLVAK